MTPLLCVHTKGGGMTHFEATVRIFDVNESSASAACRAIEERLRVAGFARWRVVQVAPQRRAAVRGESRRREGRGDISYVGGGMLAAAAVGWTLWFLWLLAG